MMSDPARAVDTLPGVGMQAVIVSVSENSIIFTPPWGLTADLHFSLFLSLNAGVDVEQIAGPGTAFPEGVITYSKLLLVLMRGLACFVLCHI